MKMEDTLKSGNDWSKSVISTWSLHTMTCKHLFIKKEQQKLGQRRSSDRRKGELTGSETKKESNLGKSAFIMLVNFSSSCCWDKKTTGGIIIVITLYKSEPCLHLREWIRGWMLLTLNVEMIKMRMKGERPTIRTWWSSQASFKSDGRWYLLNIIIISLTLSYIFLFEDEVGISWKKLGINYEHIPILVF